MYKRLFVMFLLLWALHPLYGQLNLRGNIKDSVSGKGLENVKIVIPSLKKTLYSDPNGDFRIDSISPSGISATLSKEEYFTKEIYISETEIRTGTTLSILLTPFETTTDTIDVRDKYFKKSPDVNTSYFTATKDEIRKTPGAAEDVVKFFVDAPGVSIGSDIENSLIVRGGSPAENLTVIDGIELPNPNHLGPPSSTNGLISYINLKMVKDAEFFTGGFPVKYGDKLSSVLDISFREGNSKKNVSDIFLSAGGIGIFTEGPFDTRSTYMLSVRRSYLELVKHQLNSPFLPVYWDMNLKLNYDIDKNRKLSFVAIGAIDDAKPYEVNEFEEDTVHSRILATGLIYQSGGTNYRSAFTGGFNWNYYDANFYNYIKAALNEKSVYVNEEFELKPDRSSSVKFSGGYRYYFLHYDLNKEEYRNYASYYVPANHVNTSVNTFKVYGGLNLQRTFGRDKLTLNIGARADMFGLLKNNFCLSPRLGVTYRISERVMLNLSAGIYYQSPEFTWVLADSTNDQLKYIKLSEIVMGFEYFPSADVRLSAEPYVKKNYDYPVNVYNPYYSYVNSGVEIFSEDYDRAISYGKGYSYGIDLSVQKKNSTYGIYWTANVSLSRSEFYAIKGGVHSTQYDPGEQLVLLAGYRFRSGFSISSKIKYTKGTPYTPIDPVKSQHGEGQAFDYSQMDELTLPYYLRWDLRLDYQITFGKVGLTAYVDLLNVLNRENYYGYFWSVQDRSIKPLFQLPRIPLVGINIHF